MHVWGLFFCRNLIINALNIDVLNAVERSILYLVGLFMKHEKSYDCI